MHEYDAALKSIMTQPGSGIARLIGLSAVRWHNVEMPEVRSLRADLLGETAAGDLIHVELQSTNDAEMALRMLEYSCAIFRQFNRFPRQAVLYVGNEPMRMPARIAGPHGSFEFPMIDIRTLDGESLLESDSLGDNVVAILARFGNQRHALRRILARIAEANPSERARALAELTILAGLRKLGSVLEEEVKGMPILDDIMDHDLLGPKFREGQEKGRQEGREEGRQQGELYILTRLIEKRFGTLTSKAQQRLNAMTAAQIEEASLRLLDVGTLEELLG